MTAPLTTLAPPLHPLHSLRWLAVAWAAAAAAAGFSGSPAYVADATLTIIAFSLLIGGEYDGASWVYLSSAVPWAMHAA